MSLFHDEQHALAKRAAKKRNTQHSTTDRDREQESAMKEFKNNFERFVTCKQNENSKKKMKKKLKQVHFVYDEYN